MDTKGTEYQRTSTQYPQDRVTAVHPTNRYEGVVTETRQRAYVGGRSVMSICVVDGALEVESVDAKTRQEALAYFTERQAEAAQEKDKRSGRLYKGVVGAVVGVGMGVGAFWIVPPAIAALVGASGVAFVVLGIHQSASSNSIVKALEKDLEALDKSKKEWEDPIDTITSRRRGIASGGFHYVYHNNLKGTIAHPVEVNALWIKSLEALLSHHQDLHSVYAADLLGHNAMAYAWTEVPMVPFQVGGRIMTPQFLTAMASRFQACSSAYHRFNGLVHQALAEVDQLQAQQRATLQELRTQWLAPARRVHALGLEEAAYQYEAAIAPYRRERDVAIEEVTRSCHYVVSDVTDADEMAYRNRLESLRNQELAEVNRSYQDVVRDIERDYERDRLMCDFIFDRAKLVVDAFFDGRERQLQGEVDQIKAGIEEQRKLGYVRLQEQLNSLFDANSELLLSYVVAEVPALVKNYKLNDFTREPSWNEVYGPLSMYRSEFSTSISEASWSAFWGGTGFGQYASVPRNLWSGLFVDRSSFPLRQRLHLHRPYNLIRPRMFMRNVNVPPRPVKVVREGCAPVGTREAPSETSEPRAPIGNRERERPAGRYSAHTETTCDAGPSTARVAMGTRRKG